jgi:hypothetical protein
MPRISVALIRKRAEHNEGCVSTLEVRTLPRPGLGPRTPHDPWTHHHVRADTGVV